MHDIAWCHNTFSGLRARNLTVTSHDVCKRSVEYEEQSLMAVWMRMLTSGSVCGSRHGTTLTSWSDRGKVKSNTSVSLNNQSCKCVGYLFQISPMCLCCSLPSCNIANVGTLYFILLCLWILAFSVLVFLIYSLVLLWMLWNFTWNVQQRWSPFISIWCGLFLYKCNPMYKKCKLSFDSSTLLMMNWNTPGQISISNSQFFFFVLF